jgi:hypothetical protein
MKKFLILALAIGFITTCNNKKDENDEDAILALALSQLNQLPSTCDVTVTFSPSTYNIPNVPITYSSPTVAQTVKKVDVLDSNGNKVNHVIGAVSLTAKIGTTITLTGGHYVVLYEKGAGCPIGTVDDKGNIVANTTDFSLTGITRVGGPPGSEKYNLAAAVATVKFNKAGRYFYIVYQGPQGTSITQDVTVLTTVQ